jgi:hypothetical protein
MILGDFYHGRLPTLAVQILAVQILAVQILAVQILAVQILTVQIWAVQILTVQIWAVQILTGNRHDRGVCHDALSWYIVGNFGTVAMQPWSLIQRKTR